MTILNRDAMAKALLAVVLPVDVVEPEPMVDDYDYADRVIELYERFLRSSSEHGSAAPR